MRIRIIIFSYQREQMLKALISELNAFSDYNITYTIIDDGSDFILADNFHQFTHGGKSKFWQRWDYALRMLKNDTSDLFIFLQDDVIDLNLSKVIELHNQLKHHPYAYSLINDGRKYCWNLIKPTTMDANTIKMGFVDCIFFCNKALLNKIGYYVNEVNPYRFVHNKYISSGVGQQLTYRIRKAQLSMFKPVKSLVYHGNHVSTMHAEHRKQTPLISQ